MAAPLADLRALAEKWKRPGLTCELDDDVYDDLTDLLDKHEAEPDVSERDELARAAAWVAETIGYPVETSTPDAPMPDGLWEALVDHVHADKSGRWHGNELDRDEVAAWLAEEAGRKR